MSMGSKKSQYRKSGEKELEVIYNEDPKAVQWEQGIGRGIINHGYKLQS